MVVPRRSIEHKQTKAPASSRWRLAGCQAPINPRVSVVEQKLFGVDQRPDDVFVGRLRILRVLR